MTKSFLPRVLIVTSEWPAFPGDISGIHIKNQVNRLIELGATVQVFHFRGKKNIFNYLEAIRNFSKFNFSDFDVVHAHHGQSGLVALSQKHLPVVVTFHGSDLMGIRNSYGKDTFLGFILRQVSQYVAKQADQVIIVADHLKHFISRSDFDVIPAGIDTDLFCPMSPDQARKLLKLPAEKKLVLFVGDPSRNEKRYWLASAAVNYLNADNFIELITVSNVKHEQMPLYMNACDVLLVTSSNEGSPNVVKEALACNLSIVSTDVGDINKRVKDIVGCYICIDDSPKSIAQALEQALLKRERINARETVLTLDERLLVKKVMSVYRKAINKNNL